MIILHTDAIRRLYPLINPKETRLRLCGFLVERVPEGGATLVATDGRVFGTFRLGPDQAYVPDHMDKRIVQLSPGMLKELGSKRGEVGRWLAIDETGTAAIVSYEPDQTIDAVRDLSKIIAIQSDTFIDAEPVDWRQVIPHPDKYGARSEVMLNIKLLSQFSRIGSTVTMYPSADGEGPVLLLFREATNFFGVIMPMRGGELHSPVAYYPFPL